MEVYKHTGTPHSPSIYQVASGCSAWRPAQVQQGRRLQKHVHPKRVRGSPLASTLDYWFYGDTNTCNFTRSLVMANAHAITHDLSVYSEPDRFNPDRYIPASEGGLGEPLPVGHFGFGRRLDLHFFNAHGSRTLVLTMRTTESAQVNISAQLVFGYPLQLCSQHSRSRKPWIRTEMRSLLLLR